MLRADLDAPQAARHPTRRIFDQLVAEHQMEGISYATVSDYVGWRGGARYRQLARNAPALLIRGVLQNTNGVCSLNADPLEALDLRIAHNSCDFR